MCVIEILQIPIKLKEKLCRMAKPSMLYDLKCSQCWLVKKHIQKMCVVETRMLRWIIGNTLRDRIRNMPISKKINVASMEDKMREYIKMVWA